MQKKSLHAAWIWAKINGDRASYSDMQSNQAPPVPYSLFPSSKRDVLDQNAQGYIRPRSVFLMPSLLSLDCALKQMSISLLLFIAPAGRDRDRYENFTTNPHSNVGTQWLGFRQLWTSRAIAAVSLGRAAIL